MAAMETIIDRIARLLHLDAAEVRRRNFYGDAPRNITHYGQPVEDNRLQMIYDRLKESADYDARRREVNEFNAGHEFLKKGLAMTPVKFGISFTTTYLNQAGALVNIYRDGSVLVNHGGTEMGQGLHTKILQIASHELGVPLERIRVNATSTSKVPNTSATAASSGTDLNGMAVKIAIDTLKQRIAASFAGYFSEGNDDATDTSAIRFENNEIFDSTHSERRIGFAEAMNLMNLRQISLSATGFYRAPSIGWDKEAGKGRPFLYYAFGMAVTEVLVDLLTGRHTILRTDILHDVGDSLNPAIDRGQVEGGYVQGVGWCTTEEIRWDDQGHLLTHSPDTYKIPAIRDVPKDFRVALLQGAPNPLAIHNSKAVAEPPFMFGLSAWLAIKDAISAAGNHTVEPEFSLPATNEIIVLSYEHLKQRLARRDVSTLVAE
jgi:xanthine dehydrogenase molybdopterin-binding subunit B